MLWRPSGQQAPLFISVTTYPVRWTLCRERFITAWSLRRQIYCIFASSMESWAHHHCPSKGRGETHRDSFLLSKGSADVRSCWPAPPHRCLQGWPSDGWLLVPPTSPWVHRRCTPFSPGEFCFSPQWDHWECVGQPFSNVRFLPTRVWQLLPWGVRRLLTLTLSNSYLQLIKINVWRGGAGRRGITFVRYDLQPGLRSPLRNLHE